jgi:hypothetical protein
MDRPTSLGAESRKPYWQVRKTKQGRKQVAPVQWMRRICFNIGHDGVVVVV